MFQTTTSGKEELARAALMMGGVLLAAGIFAGIMQGSGMLKAVAQPAVTFVPAGMAHHVPFDLGLISMPLSLLFDADSFYSRVLPMVAEVDKQLGVLTVQFARAALLGQMTTGFRVSPSTPAAFVGIDLGDHQKFAIPFLLGASVAMTMVRILFGVFPP
jgi:citrate-Mg2+:H+ or citrate-Ca2+:H+ symporter, CitMHS family